MKKSILSRVHSILIPKILDSIKKSASRRGIAIGKVSDVPQYRMVSDSLIRKNVGLVLDIGANRGQFARGLRLAGFRGEIYSYEPDPEVFKILEKEKVGDHLWKIFNLAIVDNEEKTIELNVASNMGYSSSVLNFSSLGQEMYPSIQMFHKISVASQSITKVLENAPENVAIYLKTDIQGFERRLFHSLDLNKQMKIKGVMLEVSIFEIYEQEWNLVEAINYFDSHGFVVIGVTPEDYDPKFGQPQVNLYLERKS